MEAAFTTGSNILLTGDFSTYRIVDHIAGPRLEYVTNLSDQATAVPNGTRGWVYWQRIGATVLDPSQWAVLKL